MIHRPARVASYVVSGVGFLGAGVIFKDGTNVRGLNTAATIWCSASIGVLCGFNHISLAAVVIAAILLTNIALRLLAHRLSPVLPAAEPAGALYELVITCRELDETHLRSLLLTTIAKTAASLQGIHSEDEGDGKSTNLRAELVTQGRQNDLVEHIALRLMIEPGVNSLSWSVVPTAIE